MQKYCLKPKSKEVRPLPKAEDTVHPIKFEIQMRMPHAMF
jgi:hypothetical protein